MSKLLSLCLVVFGLLATSPHAARAEATLFTRMVLMEAAYEPLMGRVAVAAVALDRVDDPRWPNSLQGVLRQRHQFTGLWVPFRKFRQPVINSANIAIALAVAGARPCGPGVYWYHGTYIKPPTWTERLEVACTIGLHVFYRDPT
jgi:spore germination cell wall hydrolase CwlJ-like protein